MSNFKVDNLVCNTINGNSISSLGGSSFTEYNSINTGSIQGTDFPEGSNGVEARYIRIQESSGHTKCEISEIEIYSNGTKIDGQHDIIAEASSSYNSSYDPTDLFDGGDLSDTTHNWAGKDGDNAWLIFDLKEKKNISLFKIMPCDNPNWNFPQFTLEISDDKENWTLVGEYQSPYTTTTEVTFDGLSNPKLTITEDTRIRKIEVTTKNLDGKLTVGNTVFEGTGIEDSGEAGVDPIAENVKEENKVDITINDYNLVANPGDHINSATPGSGDPVYFSERSNQYVDFTTDKPVHVFGIINDGDNDDVHQSPLIFINKDTNEEIKGIDPINITDWQHLITLPAGNWIIRNFYEDSDIGRYCSNGMFFMKAGPSIPTITKEIQLDSTTIDMELDGTVDSVDYETFSGQDIDAVSLLLQLAGGTDEQKASALTKIQKLI